MNTATQRENSPKFGTLSVFDQIYTTNYWGDGSGTGSSPEATSEYRQFLEGFMRDQGVRTVVDLGCGDWQVSNLIDWSGIRYHGFDAADFVIRANTERYAKENISFEKLSDYAALPAADLLVVKDVLQHLSNAEVKKILAEVFPKYPKILVTNCVPPIRTAFYRSSMFNRDIEIGDFRYFDIRLPPFDQPATLLLDWKINHRGPVKTVFYLAGNRRPGESFIRHVVKFPFRVIKWLLLGIDCNWRKHTLLVERNRK